MNLKIREFKLSIENYIEKTELPTEVKRMVIKEIYENISSLANEEISKEIEIREKEEKEEKKSEQSV